MKMFRWWNILGILKPQIQSLQFAFLKQISTIPQSLTSKSLGNLDELVNQSCSEFNCLVSQKFAVFTLEKEFLTIALAITMTEPRASARMCRNTPRMFIWSAVATLPLVACSLAKGGQNVSSFSLSSVAPTETSWVSRVWLWVMPPCECPWPPCSVS